MEEIKEMFQEIKAKLEAMDTKIEKVTKELDGVKQENIYLRAKITQQDKRIEILEKNSRMNNLIIKGVEEKENEIIEETKENVKNIIEAMGVKIEIDSDLLEIRRIGKYNKEKERPIITKLMRHKKKMEILIKTKTNRNEHMDR